MSPPLGFRSAMLRCARMLSDEVNTLLIPYQLNYSLWQVMYVIQEMNGCTSIEIAEILNVSKPSIAKRIHILIQQNIVMQVETDDKRQKKMVLTATGLKLYEQCSKEIDLLEQQLLHPFLATQIDVSTQLMNDLIDILNVRKIGATHD